MLGKYISFEHPGATDKSVGEDTSFLIRRARLIFYGDITDNLYLYLQPDFSSTPSGSSTGQFG